MSLLILLLNFLLLAGLVLYLRKQRWAKEIKPFFYPALLLKLVCGVLLGVLYFYYYGQGDTTYFYKRAQWANEILYLDGVEAYLRYLFFNTLPDYSNLSATRVLYYSSAWNVVKLVSVPLVITGGNYYLCSLYLSVLSFAGLWFLVDKLAVLLPGTGRAAVVAFLFVPSVAFWSSGIIKESYIMAGIGMLVGSYLELQQPGPLLRKARYTLLAAAGIVLIWLVKYFVAVAVVAFLLLASLLRYLQKIDSARFTLVWRTLVLVVLFGVVAAVASQVNYNLSLEQMPVTVYQNYIKYDAISAGKPSLHFPALQPSYLSFALHAPLAFFSILLRPFLWDAYNAITLFSALENTFILLLLLMLLKDVLQKKVRLGELRYLVFATLAYAVVMGILLAYSMPNLGTLSRYRIVVVPFLVFLLLLSPTNRTFLTYFTFKRK